MPRALAGEGGGVSAVSVWEVATLFVKGRLKAEIPVGAKVDEMLRRYPLTVVPLDAEIALLSGTLPFAHEDPADRLIAATALGRRSPRAAPASAAYPG